MLVQENTNLLKPVLGIDAAALGFVTFLDTVDILPGIHFINILYGRIQFMSSKLTCYRFIACYLIAFLKPLFCNWEGKF